MTKEDEKTVHNPQKPGVVEKMDPTTGETHSTIETGRKPKK